MPHRDLIGDKLHRLVEHGFAIVEGVLPDHEVGELASLAGDLLGSADSAGDRGVLAIPWVRHLAADSRIREWVDAALAPEALPVRAILFDKSPGANWNLGYHQDRVIAVRKRVDVEGFVGWSSKGGVPHVLAPASVLEEMIAVRLSLDDCDSDNGPLRVLPDTHRAGLLSQNEVREAKAKLSPVECTLRRGGVVIMRPLLLHASSEARRPSHRRVLHIEYAIPHLPGGLAFYDWVEGAARTTNTAL